MEITNHQKAFLATSLVYQRLTELGFNISVPLVMNTTYNLIIEKNQVLKRVQIKQLIKQKEEFFILKNQRVTQSKNKSTYSYFNENDIDIMIGVCTESRTIIAVLVKELTKGNMHFRIEVPKNNQRDTKYINEYDISHLKF